MLCGQAAALAVLNQHQHPARYQQQQGWGRGLQPLVPWQAEAMLQQQQQQVDLQGQGRGLPQGHRWGQGLGQAQGG